jgi:hypothetical protein
MSKVVRLTESDLVRIVKRVIEENDQQNLNENLWDDAGKLADKAISVGDKYLGLNSDWWYLVPGMQGIKLGRDEISALRTLQKQTFEQNMESIREFASGIKGAAVAVALDIVGVGEIINPVFWGLYTVYDLWLWAKKGVLNMFNLIIDVICLATAGLGQRFVKGFKSVMAPFAESGTSKFIAAMAEKAPKLFEYLTKIMEGSSSFFSKASSQMTKGIQLLSEELPFLTKGLESMKSSLGSLKGFLHEIEEAISHEIAHFTKHTGKHYAQHQLGHEVVGRVVGHGGGHAVSHIKPNVLKTKSNFIKRRPNILKGKQPMRK